MHSFLDTTKRRGLFLDRDGVINVDFGFVHDPSKIDLVPGIEQLVKEAQAKGYLVFVITNQSGVGRGMFPLKDVEQTNAYIEELFSQIGIRISRWYICTHAPESNCECRKPKPKFFLDAINEFHLEPGLCVSVGDKPSGSQAALASNIGKVYELKSAYQIGNRYETVSLISSLTEVQL